MKTWSAEDLLADACAVVRYTLSLTLSPVLDWVYPPDERWEWPVDGSEALNDKEAEEDAAEPCPDCGGLLPWHSVLCDSVEFNYDPESEDEPEPLAEWERKLLHDATDVAALWRAGRLRVVGCDTCESSAAAAVAENGLGGMSDAEPSPGPSPEGVGAHSPEPETPSGQPKLLEPLVRAVLAQHKICPIEDDPNLRPYRWYCVDGLGDIHDMFETQGEWREHVTPHICAHVAAVLPDYPKPKNTVDWAADTYPQHRGQR